MGKSRPLPSRSELPLLARSPGSFLRRYRWPLIALAAGATVDAITTYRNVRAYSAAVEVHPVKRLLFEVLGPEAGVPAAKLIQLAFVLLVAAWWKPWCRWVLALCGSLYALRR